MEALDDSKMPEEDSRNEPLDNKDSKSPNEPSSPVETKPTVKRKGGASRAGELTRGGAKARKPKMMSSKKEQGLSKDRIFLYKPFVPLPDLSEYVNSTIEVSKVLTVYKFSRSELELSISTHIIQLL